LKKQRGSWEYALQLFGDTQIAAGCGIIVREEISEGFGFPGSSISWKDTAEIRSKRCGSPFFRTVILLW
jgi:hypothetical protein